MEGREHDSFAFAQAGLFACIGASVMTKKDLSNGHTHTTDFEWLCELALLRRLVHINYILYSRESILHFEDRIGPTQCQSLHCRLGGGGSKVMHGLGC